MIDLSKLDELHAAMQRADELDDFELCRRGFRDQIIECWPSVSAELRELRGAVETYRHAAKLASFWFDKLQRGEPFDRAMFDEDAESIYRTVACDGDPTEMEKARAALSAAPKPDTDTPIDDDIETDCPIHGRCGGFNGDCPRC